MAVPSGAGKNTLGMYSLRLGAFNLCANGLQAFVNKLVAAVNLVYIADDAFPFGRKGGDEQGYSCADIGR